LELEFLTFKSLFHELQTVIHPPEQLQTHRQTLTSMVKWGRS